MKIMTLALILSFGLAACHKSGSKSASSTGKTAPTDPSQFLKLQSFSSCSETDEYLRVNIRAMVKKGLDQQREYLTQYPEGYPEVQADSASGEQSAPQDFTKTNVQVEGVDEPDIIKTNGTHIFSISGSLVHITQTWPAESMRSLAKIDVGGWPISLLLTEKNQLVVAYYPPMESSPAGSYDYPWYSYWNYNWNLLRLDVYDVSQADKPLLVKKLSFAGNYSTMRRQGDLIRVIQNNWNIPLMSGIQAYVTTYDQSGRVISLEEFDQRRAALEQANEAIIVTLTTQSLLKNWRESITTQTTDDVLLGGESGCQNIFASKAFDQLGFTTISSIDLADFEVAQSGLLSPVSMVYSSVDSLYLANVQWGSWWGWNQSLGIKTFIHKFKYEDPSSVNLLYQGSGAVNGYPINQFALDEYQDNLRVAVTDTQHVTEGQDADRPPVFSGIL